MTFQNYLYLAGALITSIGGGAALIFVLSSWLGKVWASRILENEKAELHKLAVEHQVRFSKLHEKQALLIEQLYEKLRQLDYGVRQVSYWMDHEPLNKDWVAKSSLALTDAYVAARRHFEQHQIYWLFRKLSG